MRTHFLWPLVLAALTCTAPPLFAQVKLVSIGLNLEG